MRTRRRVWVPDEKQREVSSVVIPLPGMKFAGYVYIDLIDAKTGRIKGHWEFPNLITVLALDLMGKGLWSPTNFHDDSSAILFAMGTGSATPTIGDPTLSFQTNPRVFDNGGFLASSSFQRSPTYPTNKSGSYFMHRLSRLFTELQATGTLTEFGIFNNTTTSPVTSITMSVRSLIKDAAGSPTSIVKTSDDQLRVTHELRGYPPIEQDRVSGTIVIAADSYSFTASAISFDDTNTWGWSTVGAEWPRMGIWTLNAAAYASVSILADVTGTSAQYTTPGSGVTNTSGTISPYLSGTFMRDQQAEWKPSVANFGPGGIQGFDFGCVINPNSVVKPHIVKVINLNTGLGIPKTTFDRLRVTFRQFFGAITIPGA